MSILPVLKVVVAGAHEHDDLAIAVDGWGTPSEVASKREDTDRTFRRYWSSTADAIVDISETRG